MLIRIIVNNTQKNFISKAQKYEDRYNEIRKNSYEETELKDWRTKGNHIVVIPPSYHTARWYGIDRHEWVNEIVNKLKQHTDREIRVRFKYVDNAEWGPKLKKPLNEDLKERLTLI